MVLLCTSRLVLTQHTSAVDEERNRVFRGSDPVRQCGELFVPHVGHGCVRAVPAKGDVPQDLVRHHPHSHHSHPPRLHTGESSECVVGHPGLALPLWGRQFCHLFRSYLHYALPRHGRAAVPARTGGPALCRFDVVEQPGDQLPASPRRGRAVVVRCDGGQLSRDAPEPDPDQGGLHSGAPPLSISGAQHLLHPHGRPEGALRRQL
mmetsp:Transcript_41619/g.103882  ORF Transcript_41619/g.103882 Transcript_41619/m.103882 type:complete len:206 (+) Transcript_41619:1195-1812(+)